ncbi:hypothetical protein GCM10011375_40160 [Hymenobacter qilianensis]|uniref:Uncharacterized protein n=2 Tax=Hymenobacter qilianensis TaxID=1385715 RepID=A0ACB5PX81_9BACT|nr:hypothetical protein [Hymenobacter qilianensis]QNP54484.1 hypothetical protein H9L05_22565 [Hymenobacter qilianensis]GGF81159.1 hypothetical protein GCM10011375_40160 [Hymenobacter qilianensis]
MKTLLTLLLLAAAGPALAQIDPTLLRDPGRLRRVPADTMGRPQLNLDAVYNRPFLQAGRLPVALGGYVEANYQNGRTDGIGEGHQFQMRRVTLFVSSAISKRVKFLTEIEFEDGTKEINIEFASVDFEFSPLLNVRGGIVMNPIGAFNQNHDGPKWEFVDRPIAATQLLPATWSNVGAGLFGKKYTDRWVFAYEAYLTNGFDNSVVDNPESRTFLPASKANPDRFEENVNGQLLTTAKVALRRQKVGELGLSHMGQVYNKFEDDGLVLDQRRRLDVWAVDANTTLPGTRTALTGEWAWVRVNVPDNYAPQYGGRQMGGFLDLVQPLRKGRVFGYENAVLNAGLRLEYVDWNRDRFAETGGAIGDETWAVVPALSWRPSPLTVVRLNYRSQWARDFLGNPAVRSATVQVGLSSYF